jgi:hypothetical protein
MDSRRIGAPGRSQARISPVARHAEGGPVSATRSRWVYPAIIVVLLLVIAAMAWKFVVAGSTAPAEDGRIAVMLEPAERAIVLREMRGFVVGVQKIADALSRDDMNGVAAAAQSMGRARMADAPVAMMGKLPFAFKTLAFGVHQGFDALAADAQKGATSRQSLAQLSVILEKCVACHATYALGTPSRP